MNLDELAARYRLLALEGCDGAGKSTLAATLNAQHGYRVIHSPRTPDFVDLVTRYQQILAEPGRLVLDRCFVSELVYGPLRHDRSRLPWIDAVDLSQTLAAQGGAFVHLTGTSAMIRHRLGERGDADLPLRSDLDAIVGGYRHVFDILRLHAPVIDINIAAIPHSGE